MTYEEKRELRLQISQLLADAGLNQKVIKDMVETEIVNKVDRAVEQCNNGIIENNKCEKCMFDAPYKWCCKRECGEHVFCKDCNAKSKGYRSDSESC